MSLSRNCHRLAFSAILLSTTTLVPIVAQSIAANAQTSGASTVSLTAAQRIRSKQLFNRGTKLYRRGKLDAAAQAFQQAQAINPSFEHAYYLGITQLNSLQNAAAIPSFRRAIQLAPKHRLAAFAYSHIGKAHLNLRQYRRAIAAYEQATIRRPKNPQFHENLGIAYHLDRQFQRAMRAYEQALKLNPNNQDIRQVLRKAQLRQKPWQ